MIWKIIDKYDRYSVSDSGLVKRNSFTNTDALGRRVNYEERILKLQKDKDGYSTVILVSGLDKPKLFRVHRLVAMTFIPNPNNYPCVNHKDENKANNYVDNLEWCTVAYNNIYGNRAILAGCKRRKTIYQYSLDGELLRVWEKASDIEKEKGFSASNICSCCNNKLKTAYKYIWKYNLIKKK